MLGFYDCTERKVWRSCLIQFYLFKERKKENQKQKEGIKFLKKNKEKNRK